MKSLTLPDPSVPDELETAVRRPSRRLWLFAVAAFALLTSLAVAFSLLVTTRKPTVDALVIVTLPSGAEVEFDGRPLGPSPVKLENVRTGQHTVRAAKEGFVPAEQEVSLEGEMDGPLELAMRPVAPPGSVAQTPAEQIEEFTRLAESAFARGAYALPADRSALYYADAVLAIDRRSQYAAELRKRVLAKLHADARSAFAAKDFARALGAYRQILDAFPGDEEAASGAAGVQEQIRRQQSRLEDLAQIAERSGDLRGAIDLLRRARRLGGPADPGSERIERRIVELERRAKGSRQ